MPTKNQTIAAPKQGGGFWSGILVYAVGVSMVFGFIFYMLGGFDGKAAKFQRQCWYRELDKIEAQGRSPSDDERLYIVRKCTDELTEYLDQRGK